MQHLMLAHFARHWPEEACGLLAGRLAPAMTAHAQMWYPIENEWHSPTRYRMEARALLAAFDDMEARGLELVGIAHSHPHGPGHPSPTDVAEAYYPEAVYLIAAPDMTGAWQVRAFTITAGQALAVPIHST